MKNLLTICLFCTLFGSGITAEIPAYYTVNDSLSQQLKAIVHDIGLDGNFDVGEDGIEQVSLAIIVCAPEKPQFGGVYPDNFIYPASVYKMYVAAEVLHQIADNKYQLTTPYLVKSPNVVDTVKEILSDPRALLADGDTVTINYLLDLMITRSDNTAANCLIDVAGRENINALIHSYSWQGSEVTRKFLSRKYEDPAYKTIRGTETCALHAADFLYRIETNKLVNPWVSQQMKVLLGRQLDKSKLASGLPRQAMLYHKTGWFAYWTNDVAIVDTGHLKYIIACFMPLPEAEALPKFAAISKRIHALLEKTAYRF